jgi:predicted nucleic acid-binding protein
MVVDASVWVSTLVSEDVHHERSRRWVKDRLTAGTTLIMPVLALVEVVGAVVRRTGREDLGRQVIEDMTRASDLRLIPVGMDLARAAATLAASYRLRGADAIYAALADKSRPPSCDTGSRAEDSARWTDHGHRAVTLH